MKSGVQFLMLGLVGTLVLGCKREQRVFDSGSAGTQVANGVSLTTVHAGGSLPSPEIKGVEHNAYAVSEGKRLYNAYNCVGCHAHGGGGIGPPLLDKKWFYGSEPEQVYLSILQGRPNGMPSFRGRIPVPV